VAESEALAYMSDDYNLPHGQSHSLYLAYEFTMLNCKITLG